MAGPLRRLARVSPPVIHRRLLVREAALAAVSRLAPKATSTLLAILLVRRYGPNIAGAYTLSVSYSTVLVLLSSFGLDELVLREVAIDPEKTRKYLLNAAVVRALLALVSYAALVGLVLPRMGYGAAIRQVIRLQGLSVLPLSLSAVVSAVFAANQRMVYVAAATGLTAVLQLTGGLVAIRNGAPLVDIVRISVVAATAGSLAQLGLAGWWSARQGAPRGDPTVTLAYGLSLVRRSLPFFLVIGLASLDADLNVLVLSRRSSIEAVGWYGAARVPLQVLLLLPQSLRQAIYPAMSRGSATSEADLRRIYRTGWLASALLAFPIAVGGQFFSGPILRLVYPDVTSIAIITLNVLLGHLLANFLYQSGTRLLVATEQQAALAAFLGGSIILNLLCSLFLVPRHGAVGAAAARALSSVVYFLMVEIHVWRRALPRAAPIGSLPSVVGAVTVMVCVLLASQKLQWPIRAVLGSLTYIVVVAVLADPIGLGGRSLRLQLPGGRPQGGRGSR